MKNIQQLKRELAAAGLSVVVTAVALSSATYAWFVTNNKVDGTTSTISATTNGFILQIGELSKGAQHGGEQKSLEATSKGATLSPASTDDLKNWYVCQSFNNQGLVTDYSEPAFATGANAIPGNYDKDYFAFIKSDYIVYTITETGTADVYLDASDGAPVTITAKGGDGSKTVTDSIRVAITTQAVAVDRKTPVGEETLRVVYAKDNETGEGNDSTAKAGWTRSGSASHGQLSHPRPFFFHDPGQQPCL